MFPFGFVIPVTIVLLFSVAAALFGFIGGGTLAFAWVLTFAILIGALLVLDGHGSLRRIGAGMLAVAVLGVALMIGMHPAAAQVAAGIAAPPGDTGLWAWINPYLEEGIGAAVAALAGWALKEIATHTRIRIRADQEAQIRETMKTAAFAGAHEMELFIGDHFTPAQQATLVKKMTTWAEVRAAAQLKKLGLPNFVVEAMAHKVLGEVQGLAGGYDPIDAAITGSAPYTGNPGETPALDRVLGTGGN